MRIAQVSDTAAAHRETIHHYIQLGLVCPATEQENGYYDFSQEDLRRLQTIQRLRLLDCPLSLIRDLLDHPRLSRFLLDRMIQQKAADRDRPVADSAAGAAGASGSAGQYGAK